MQGRPGPAFLSAGSNGLRLRVEKCQLRNDNRQPLYCMFLPTDKEKEHSREF
jgi:hypothetical protein